MEGDEWKKEGRKNDKGKSMEKRKKKEGMHEIETTEMEGRV